jgi:hypothetical protein
VLFLTLLPIVYCFDNSYKTKLCSNCKWFVPNGARTEYGLCKLFKERMYIVDKEKLISNFADHCRKNELLCGKEGRFYEDNEGDVSSFNIEEKLKKFDHQYKDLIEKFDESLNDGHGEVTEKPELDKLNELDKEIETFTKEGLELLFKVQKFNKKKILCALDKIYPKNDKFTRY